MSNSSTGKNVVYVDHRGTSSRLAYPQTSTTPDSASLDVEHCRYFKPGARDIPVRMGFKQGALVDLLPPGLQRRALLHAALEEGDSKYGEMLRRLAE